MTDLKSKKLIACKGFLFIGIAVLSGGLLFARQPDPRTAFLVMVLIWASARAYYFLFYVLHEYVDPRYKYAGLLSMLQWIKNDKADGGGPAEGD